MPEPYKEVLRGFATDRKDFYHQFQTTWERSRSNVIYPLFKLSKFRGLKGYGDCKSRFVRARRAGREAAGDFLHGCQRSILVDDESLVAVAFSALFQGDHLGVEIACSAQEGLLSASNLLEPCTRHVSDAAVLDDAVTEGLVIDDYFVVAKGSSASDSCAFLQAQERMMRAKAAYQQEGILGSDDKDVWGELRFKGRDSARWSCCLWGSSGEKVSTCHSCSSLRITPLYQRCASFKPSWINCVCNDVQETFDGNPSPSFQGDTS